jgi:DNA repair ATPase RecN
MNTETQVPTGEETQNQAPVTEEKPEVVTPEATEDAGEEAKSAETPEQLEFKRLQRQLRKAERNNAKLYAETQLLREHVSKVDQTEPKAESRNVEVEAELIAEAKMFAKTAEKIVESGKKADPKFRDALRDLSAEVGDFVQPNGLPSTFMRAVLDVSEDPTKLLLHLGKNPDLASELADLPVTKLAARLDRIEREMTATPKHSSAPKPLEPVKSKSSDSGLHNELSTEEWMKRREAQVRERRQY